MGRPGKILALAAGGAFGAAFALDLLTKLYAVERFDSRGAIVYNQRPHDLAVRIDVSVLTIAALFLLERAGRRRGLGRLWGGWICIGILVAGTLANGVSSYLWDRGVPDFIHLSGGWVWNIADFEIVFGLLGAAAAVIVSAMIAFVWPPAPQVEEL